MKKALLTLAIAGVAGSLLAQGRVSIVNNVNTVISWSSNPDKLQAAEKPLAGQPIATSYTGLAYQLYGNPSQTATELQLGALGSKIVFPAGGLVAGRFSSTPLTLPDGYVGGTRASFQLRFFSSQYASYEAAVAAGNGGASVYTGLGPVFTMIPGPSLNNSIVQTSSPALSTWGGPGSPGVAIGLVPEPATASIIGLGLASLLVLRRRQ